MSESEEEEYGYNESRVRAWTVQEDGMLTQQLGYNADVKNVPWASYHEYFPERSAKQLSDRYNMLVSGNSLKEWSAEDDSQIIEQHRIVGTKWKEYVKVLVNKSDNAVKNRWNSTLRRVQRYEQNIKKQGLSAVKQDVEQQPLFKYCRQVQHTQDNQTFPILENGTTSLNQTTSFPAVNTTKRGKSAPAKTSPPVPMNTYHTKSYSALHHSTLAYSTNLSSSTSNNNTNHANTALAMNSSNALKPYRSSPIPRTESILSNNNHNTMNNAHSHSLGLSGLVVNGGTGTNVIHAPSPKHELNTNNAGYYLAADTPMKYVNKDISRQSYLLNPATTSPRGAQTRFQFGVSQPSPAPPRPTSNMPHTPLMPSHQTLSSLNSPMANSILTNTPIRMNVHTSGSKLESPSTVADSIYVAGSSPSSINTSSLYSHFSTSGTNPLYNRTNTVGNNGTNSGTLNGGFATPHEKRTRSVFNSSITTRRTTTVSASPPNQTESPEKTSLGISSESAHELAMFRTGPSVEDDVDHDLRNSTFVSKGSPEKSLSASTTPGANNHAFVQDHQTHTPYTRSRKLSLETFDVTQYLKSPRDQQDEPTPVRRKSSSSILQEADLGISSLPPAKKTKQ